MERAEWTARAVAMAGADKGQLVGGILAVVLVVDHFNILINIITSTIIVMTMASRRNGY